MNAGWGYAARSIVDITHPQGSAEARAWAAKVLSEGTTAEHARRLLGRNMEIDLSHLLGSVSAPALVLHRRSDRTVAFRAGRALAAALPNASLVGLEGDTHWFWYEDSDAVVAPILEFLDQTYPSRPGEFATGLSARATVKAILFTDLENHSAMMNRLGDAEGRALLRQHESVTRQALSDHGGVEVKAMGDGFMASFGSAQSALACAAALQRAFVARNASAQEPLMVRVGINAGEPIVEDGDLFGSSVILAARIASKARGGQVLVSNVVRDLVAGKSFLFSDLGDVEMRGFEDPIRLHELRWEA
jgi:class 3 adenylate cyclase